MVYEIVDFFGEGACVMRRWIKNAALAVSLLFLAAFLLTAHSDGSQRLPLNNEGVTLLNEGWILYQADGSTVPISLPAQLPWPAGTWLRIERDIPADLPGPLVLCLRSSQQKVRVLVDGEEIYTFGLDAGGIPFGHSPGSAWNLVRLPEGSAGGRVTIELCSPYPVYRGTVSEVRVGSKAALLFWLVQTYLPALTMTLFIFLVGVGLILCHLLFFKRHSAGHSALYLGCFSLLVSLWLLGETRMVQFFTGNVFGGMIVTILSMMLFLVPLLLYVGDIEGFHCRRLLRGAAAGLYLATLAACGMAMWGALDLIMMLPVLHGLLLLAGALLLGLVLAEWLHWHNGQARTITLSLLIVCAFGVLEIAQLYITAGRNTGAFMRVGVLLFIAVQAVLATQRASQIVRLSREATVDGLTGCLNRTAYRQQLPHTPAADCAAVMVDLNDLKAINDTYGHEAGDVALTRCAKCFLAVYHTYGSCFRLGGDEFLFLGHALDGQRLERLAQELHQALDKAGADTPYPLKVALGWAVFDPSRDSALTDTIHRADQAMYANKRALK